MGGVADRRLALIMFAAIAATVFQGRAAISVSSEVKRCSR